MNHNLLQHYVRSKYPSAYDLVIYGGKLTGDWSNVATHCFLQAVAAESLGELLGLEANSIQRLASTAAYHDWNKRLQKRPSDFTEAETAAAETYRTAALVDNELLAALEPSFLLLVRDGQASFLQLIQFLIDDMTMNDQLVTFDERLREVQERNPDPDPHVSQALGRPYWHVEREVGHSIEAMLFAIIRARRLDLTTPTQLVLHLNGEILARLQAFAVSA